MIDWTEVVDAFLPPVPEPEFTVRKLGYWMPRNQEIEDDGTEMRWYVFHSLPGMEQEAMAARKRMLELGWGAGRIGPKGKLP